MVDFICLGDATQDNFFFINEASVHCDVNNQNCTLDLKYGQKIPVDKYASSLGGNAANVATGLSRLGLRTGLVTTFGGDNRGMWIQKQLMQNNVDLTFCAVDGARESNLSSIIVFKGERTILSYHCPVNDQIKELPDSKWVYLTSSSGRNSNAAFALIEGLPKEIKIAFNPNIEDLKKGSEYLKPVLERCEVLIMNKEEGETLLDGIKVVGSEIKEKNIENWIKEIKVLGPKIVVVTDGKNGAHVWDGENYYFKGPSKDECFEATGAGDAFSSGFLAGLFYGEGIEEAMEWGVRNAGGVIRKIGAIEGLLNKKEIEI